jgi:OmpA-OmpF porin, OOP family
VRDTVRIVQRDTVFVQRSDTVYQERVQTRVESDITALTAPLLFANGSSKPGPEASARVERLAAWMLADEKRTLHLIGRADGTGSASANQAIALRRAEGVKELLLRKGIAADRISTEGQVALSPAADPSMRRVEISTGIR